MGFIKPIIFIVASLLAIVFIAPTQFGFLGVPIIAWGIYKLNKHLNKNSKLLIPSLLITFGLIFSVVWTGSLFFSGESNKVANNIETKTEATKTSMTNNDTEDKVEIKKHKNKDLDRDKKDKIKKEPDKTHQKTKSDNKSKNTKEKTTSQDTSTQNKTSKEKKKKTAPGDATATVTRIVDGDTIEINLNGKTEDVRLLLVDTPETKHPSKPVQPFGPQASQFAKNKLTGKQVRVEYDGPKRDKYDRLLAYLWVNGKNFNKMLLEQGLARYAYVYDPPYTHSNSFMKAQNRAKNANKGIWSRNNYVTSEGFNYQEPQQSSSTETASADTSQKKESSSASTSSGYNPNGPDRDCGDFDTQTEAQDFYEAAGGPSQDPHRLDGNDNDGKVCESLPAA